jgi:hypothetical protein
MSGEISSVIRNCCKEHVDFYESKIKQLEKEIIGLKREIKMCIELGVKRIEQNKILKEACEKYGDRRSWTNKSGYMSGQIVGLLRENYFIRTFNGFEISQEALKKCEEVK